MPDWSGGRPALFALLAGAAMLGAGPGTPTETLALSSELRVIVLRGRDVLLQVRARAGDDYSSIARRVSSGADATSAIASWNHESPVEEGRWVETPVALLADSHRSLVLRALFPGDRLVGEDWVHLARSGALPTYDEGLWQIAQWFTDGGQAYEHLLRANDLRSPELERGQTVRIPASLLHPAFRARPRSDDGSLEYGADEGGPYAAYRLAPGQALYSAVVVRYTGRTAAEDVGALSARVAERSGIADLHDIPAGFEIKIPLDLLEPEFLPMDHPKRLEFEARRRAMARELAERPVARRPAGLEGVLVVLDPGHGGRDMGTMHNGVWEHDYVYDVACRLKRTLEQRTAAKVALTLEDLETGCEPSSGDRLTANRQGTILTSPPFLAKEEGEADIGVNLRWYLANSLYRRALADGIASDRVMFLSLHADSRHPSLRGVMVYVPGAAYRTKTYGSTAEPYAKYDEVQEKPHVHFSKKELLLSEAVSRKFADQVVRSFREEGLPVQAYQPVREKVIRGKEKWVPAVLRGNVVPNKVLVEMVNLGNPEDAELLGSAAARERLAEALSKAVLRHFGEPVAAASAAARP